MSNINDQQFKDNQTPTAMTIGNGKSVHVAYMVGENMTGSLCDPYVYAKGSRMRATDAEANCPRCAKASKRGAESARQS